MFDTKWLPPPKAGCGVSDSTVELGFKPLHLGEYEFCFWAYSRIER